MIHLVDLSKSLLSFSMGLNTTPATRLFVQNNSIIKKGFEVYAHDVIRMEMNEYSRGRGQVYINRRELNQLIICKMCKPVTNSQSLNWLHQQCHLKVNITRILYQPS